MRYKNVYRQVPVLPTTNGSDNQADTFLANLHAYWVYEAKIVFLLSIATSRKGAEDLLDAGVFEVFSMCGFVAVQPITDDSMGKCEYSVEGLSINCSDDAVLATDTTGRQHRVLINALQLFARTLASLHKSTRTGAGHVSR